MLCLLDNVSPTHSALSYNLSHCLLLANAPETDKKDLLSELELLKTLKPHDHVIKLLGCVTEYGKKNILHNNHLRISSGHVQLIQDFHGTKIFLGWNSILEYLTQFSTEFASSD